jgi:hypothetical protein
MALWAPSSLGHPDLVPTRALLANPGCARVLDLVRQVRAFFPELDGFPIRVGLTRRAAGYASLGEDPVIWINPRRLRRHTIAHEFVHLLQARGLVPAGEKSADLFALARHPALADDLPCYLRVPWKLRTAPAAEQARVAGLLYRLAREAASRRDAGQRTYLRWFERAFEAQWKEIRTSPEVPAEAPQQRLF